MTDDKLDIKTFSLEEVAAMVLPPDMTNGVRWLSHRLNRGELSGYRVGRTWRMTHADVENLIERHRNRPLPRIDMQAPGTDFLIWLKADFAPTARARPIFSIVQATAALKAGDDAAPELIPQAARC
ncbi:MAG: hypothetical protein QOJ20_3680 [Mycobacterium sp.]|nr:hypothetical protein [Mycobacterium sp.]